MGRVKAFKHSTESSSMLKPNSLVKYRFGEIFKTKRLESGYSRRSLSEELGVSQKTIQSWEVGRTFIDDLASIPKIERVLNCSVTDMLRDSLSCVD